jgi:hypothetical protein
VNPAAAKAYFFGAEVHSDWKEGSPITFTGEFSGNSYHEKGIIPQCQRIESGDLGVILSVSEDNIPDETKRARSDEFWARVLSTIKDIVEAGT